MGGTKLTRSCDRLAEATGISRIWLGLLLLAGVTSLPELTTSLSSVTLADAPDLAIGIILGSVLFNIVLIAVLDYFQGQGAIMPLLKPTHILSASIGAVLLGLVIGGISLGKFNAVGNIGYTSILIALVYLCGMRFLFISERKESMKPANKSEGEENKGKIDRRIYAYIAISSALVIGGGIQLSRVADTIVSATAITQTFMGTLLVAIISSLPELSVCLAAVRLGAYDMGVANLLGSNICNVAIVPVADILYSKAPLLSVVSGRNSFTAGLGIILTGIFIFALVYRSKKSIFKLEYASIFIIILYLVGVWILFKMM